MSIGNINSYNTANVLGQETDTTANKISNLNTTDLANSTDDELMNACKQFEAYFVEQVFKEMKKTIPQSEETSGATSGLKSYFEDEMLKEYASESTENNSLGLAQMLYEQMKRNYSTEAPGT